MRIKITVEAVAEFHPGRKHGSRGDLAEDIGMTLSELLEKRDGLVLSSQTDVASLKPGAWK